MNPPIDLVAIDPGRQGLGWAHFYKGRLDACGVVPALKATRSHTQPDLGLACAHAANWVSEALPGLPRHTARVVVERMAHYPGSKAADSKAADLLDLQAIGAFVAGRLNPLPPTYYTPKQWKGSTPKAIQGRRILAALGPEEWPAAEALKGAKAHNALDAIGIGLHHLGRL